jgi:hypothetical protein
MVGEFLLTNAYYSTINLKRKQALVETNLLSNRIDAYTKKEG